jgi:hypothetical protein
VHISDVPPFLLVINELTDEIAEVEFSFWNFDFMTSNMFLARLTDEATSAHSPVEHAVADKVDVACILFTNVSLWVNPIIRNSRPLPFVGRRLSMIASRSILVE